MSNNSININFLKNNFFDISNRATWNVILNLQIYSALHNSEHKKNIKWDINCIMQHIPNQSFLNHTVTSEDENTKTNLFYNNGGATKSTTIFRRTMLITLSHTSTTNEGCTGSGERRKVRLKWCFGHFTTPCGCTFK